jgi:hypothetical protein
MAEERRDDRGGMVARLAVLNRSVVVRTDTQCDMY